MTENKVDFRKFGPLTPLFKLSNDKYDVLLSYKVARYALIVSKVKRNKICFRFLIKP